MQTQRQNTGGWNPISTTTSFLQIQTQRQKQLQKINNYKYNHNNSGHNWEVEDINSKKCPSFSENDQGGEWRVQTTTKNSSPTVVAPKNKNMQNMKSRNWKKISWRSSSALSGHRVAQLVAAGLGENGERMRKWRGNGERMRKWREIQSLHFLIFSFFSPSLSISYIKKCFVAKY